MGDDSLSTVATKSTAHYNLKEYAASVRTMQKLLQNQDEDFKVSHNIALCEYKLGESKQPLVLLEALKKIDSEVGAKQQEDDEVASLSILRFNQAVLYLKLKQYNKGVEILENMYSNLSQQEDQIGFKVCFLLLDVYLFLKQIKNAAKMLDFLSLPTTYAELSKKRNAGMGSEGLEAQLEKQETENASPKNGEGEEGEAVDEEAAEEEEEDNNEGEVEGDNEGDEGDKSDKEGENVEKTASSTANTVTAAFATTEKSANAEVNKMSNKKHSNGLSVSNGLSPIQFSFNLQLYKTRFYLVNRNFKRARREIIQALTMYEKEISSRKKKESDEGDEEEKDKTENASSPKSGEENNSHEKNSSEGGEEWSLSLAHLSSALYLKARVEYLLTNYENAIISLANSRKNASSSSSSSLYLSQFYNNLACIHSRMHKYSSSQFLFTKAYVAMKEHVEGEYLESKTQILYHLSLQLLHNHNNNNNNNNFNNQKSNNNNNNTNNKKEDNNHNNTNTNNNNNLSLAFSSLQALRSYYAFFPIFWFRLAECCLKIFIDKQQTNNINMSANENGFRILGGNTKLRRVVLAKRNSSKDKPVLDNNEKHEKEKEGADEKQEENNNNNNNNNNNTVNNNEDSPSVEYAIRCLRNALYLLSVESSSSSSAQTTASSVTSAILTNTSSSLVTTTTNVTPSPKYSQIVEFDMEKEKESKRETQRMTCLLYLMYAELCVSDPVGCVRDGTRLLAMRNVPSLYRYYVHMYSAEAYCFLNAPDKALRELVTADKLEELEHPYDVVEGPKHPNYLKAALYSNLAATRIAKNELLEAQECVNHALSLIPDFNPARKCLLYLQLRLGNSDAALGVLRGKRQLPSERT